MTSTSLPHPYNRIVPRLPFHRQLYRRSRCTSEPLRDSIRTSQPVQRRSVASHDGPRATMPVWQCPRVRMGIHIHIWHICDRLMLERNVQREEVGVTGPDMRSALCPPMKRYRTWTRSIWYMSFPCSCTYVATRIAHMVVHPPHPPCRTLRPMIRSSVVGRVDGVCIRAPQHRKNAMVAPCVMQRDLSESRIAPHRPLWLRGRATDS